MISFITYLCQGLDNLDGESLSSAQGLNKAVDCIQSQIERILEKDEKKYFVLVLDEYDVIFSDGRGNPSDFVYKLLQMEENLREWGLWVCIITISNNALYEYELDDRVKSRMGSAEIHFTPYSENNIFGYVVERFFAWLKCGFHRTRIRYERLAENYLAFLNIVSIMMYWRVLE
jgi:hypothetical protein